MIHTKVKRGLLLNVVVGERATIFELLAGEDEALLVRRDALLVLDLRLHVIDSVGRLNLEGDRLAGKGLDKDLHASAKTKDEVKGALLLDVVVGKGTAILELLASEDKTLLIRRDSAHPVADERHAIDVKVALLTLPCPESSP